MVNHVTGVVTAKQFNTIAKDLHPPAAFCFHNNHASLKIVIFDSTSPHQLTFANTGKLSIDKKRNFSLLTH